MVGAHALRRWLVGFSAPEAPLSIEELPNPQAQEQLASAPLENIKFSSGWSINTSSHANANVSAGPRRMAARRQTCEPGVPASHRHDSYDSALPWRHFFCWCVWL